MKSKCADILLAQVHVSIFNFILSEVYPDG
jgi:hypothetical protein